jgi:thioesterase domain-containing protein
MTKDEMQAIDELANALQVAAPLSTTLRRVVGDAAQYAIDLEAAIDRAVRAMRRMQPKGGAQ